MGFAIDGLGEWNEGPEYRVEAERTKAYAAATNDPIAAHLGGEVGGRSVYGYETTDDSGEVVIKDGLAEVSP